MARVPSQPQAFDPHTLYDLPEKSPRGETLTLKIRALEFEEFLAATKRLPGGVPNIEETEYTLENVEALEHDMRLAAPIMEAVCGAAVLEPRICFGDTEPEPGQVRWSWLSIVNRLALFRFILQWSGFEGGAAQSLKSLPAQRKSRSAGGVGDRRGRKATK